MKKVTLEIKAVDILNSTYTNADGCAITKALERAGLNAEDAGTRIVNSADNDITTDEAEDYRELRSRVIGMYRFKEEDNCYHEPFNITDSLLEEHFIEPEDFTFEIELDI